MRIILSNGGLMVFFHGTKRFKITNKKIQDFSDGVGKKPKSKEDFPKAQTIGARKRSKTSGDAGKAKLHFLPGTLNKP